MAIEFNLENLHKLEEDFQPIYEFGDLDAAKKVYVNLDRLLTKETEKQEPDLYKKYEHIKAKYGFVCLASLSEKEILELLSRHLAVIFEILDYNLWENLKKYLIIYSDYKERDRIKNEIKSILIKNKAKITKTNLLIDNKEISGTLDNWLRDYHINFGLGPVDPLKFAEYFLNSSNIKRANANEKERIKNLFKFYEKLKLSSNSPQGFEEKVLMKINGKLQVWSDGQLEDIDPEVIKVVEDLAAKGFFKDKKDITADLPELKKMVTKYPVGSFERKAIEEEIKKLES